MGWGLIAKSKLKGYKHKPKDKKPKCKNAKGNKVNGNAFVYFDAMVPLQQQLR